MKKQDQTPKNEFDALVEEHSQLINKLCYFYSSDSDDFDDMRQEALLNIWRSMDQFRGEAKQSTFIYRVVINSCISYVRHEKKRFIDSVTIDTVPDFLPDDSAEKNRQLAEMYALINRLGEVDKAVVLMWLDGRSYDEIAQVVGIAPSTVGSRLFRIKEKLVKLSNQ